MHVYHLRTGVLMALLLTWSAAADGPTARTPVWSILERLLSQEDQRPEPPAGAGDSTERTFLFDEVLALEPAALLRGAAYVAVRNPAPDNADAPARAAHARRVEQELQAVLEYYPLIATTEADFLLLTEAIANGTQPPALRRFLLRNCAPSTSGSTAFQRYLQAHLENGSPALQDTLIDLLQNPTEDGELQEAAAGVVGPLVSQAFQWIIAHDMEAKAHAASTGQTIDIRSLLEAPGLIPLAKASSVQIEQQRQRAGALAGLLASVAMDGSRTPEMQKVAGETSTWLYQAYPLPAPEQVLPPPPPLPEPAAH